MTVRETDFTLAETYGADEAFATGTLSGITPVTRIDGRRIGSGGSGPLTARLSAIYEGLGAGGLRGRTAAARALSASMTCRSVGPEAGTGRRSIIT